MFSSFLRSPVSGWLFIIAAAAVITLIAYIYNEGKQACEAENTNAGVAAISEALQDNDSIERQVNETPDIDKLLYDLGIMRKHEDR